MASLLRALGAKPQSEGARLLERLSATQLADRRDAIVSFKELSTREAVRLIDEGGMSKLVALLREDDTQLSRDTLETLVNLVDPEVPRDAPNAEVAAVHNSAVFLTHDSNLADALNASYDDELYVRFHTVQLVLRLLAAARRQTQEAVLNQPASVGRIMTLVADRREIVRNEVLLLLARLGEGSPDLQNILAFQGAHEQLLAIIEAEAAADDDAGSGGGSVIVHGARAPGRVPVGDTAAAAARAVPAALPLPTSITATAPRAQTVSRSSSLSSPRTPPPRASSARAAASSACHRSSRCRRRTTRATPPRSRSRACCSGTCSRAAGCGRTPRTWRRPRRRCISSACFRSSSTSPRTPPRPPTPHCACKPSRLSPSSSRATRPPPTSSPPRASRAGSARL